MCRCLRGSAFNATNWVILMQSIDFRKKICLIGDPGVGKTSLIRRFVHDTFDERYLSTMGVKVSKKVVELTIDGETFSTSLQIWDTMGQRKYRTILMKYFKGAEGAMVVCDITQRPTLTNAAKWSKLLFSVAGRVPVVYLANKVDLHEKAAFAPEDLAQLAEANDGSYFATSAKTGVHVEAAFVRICDLLVHDSCVAESLADLRGAAERIVALFCQRHGGAEAAMPMVRQQCRRVSLDYDTIAEATLSRGQMEELIEKLVAITKAFKGEDIARAERREFRKLLKRV